MKKYKFIRNSENDLIIANAIIDNKFKLNLAIDTAATHTTIDSNILYLAGYKLSESKKIINIETANGII